MRVLGVDGYPRGWVGVALGLRDLRTYVAPDLLGLVSRAQRDGPVERVGIDIPIGLVDTGWRRADDEASRLLGARRASIFRTPVRAALEAPSHAAGVALSRARSGAGFSIQAWGLREKIVEVDVLLRGGDDWIHEVHPELTFATMAGHPPAYAKKTWSGQRERIALLGAAGIDLRQLAGDPGTAAPDDVVDAAACAWTARRLVLGTATSVPDPPEPVPYGLRAAIWS